MAARVQLLAAVIVRRQSRQRGFSLITVFMLMVIMTGTAIGVLIASQSDINLAGVGREQQMALYAAEYAVARAKGFAGSQTIPLFSSTAGWNFLLTPTGFPNIAATLCSVDGTTPPAVNAAAPGVLPQINGPIPQPNQLLYSLVDRQGTVLTGIADVKYNWCYHNNADDPGFLNPSSPIPNGNVSDTLDPNHYIVIEAYGYAPNNAMSHLTVTMGPPTLNTTGGSGSYAQEGAGATHTGSSGTGEVGIPVSSGTVKF